MFEWLKKLFSAEPNTRPVPVVDLTRSSGAGSGLESHEPVAFLYRAKSSDQGTLGSFKVGDLSLATIELPWYNNQSNISSIPPGEYTVVPHRSRKYGECFWVKNVPGRFAILIHCGNYAGNKAKGYKTHSAGCILIGTHTGTLQGQKAVLGSRVGKRKLLDELSDQTFRLVIRDYEAAREQISSAA